MVAAGFTATEAEELRRAFGFKRSERLMADVETKLRAGMARQGIHGAAAEEIVHATTSFALYGFPESHASSFALLAYASAYLKVHHPAAFYAALLNNQPMGLYHPATLIKDAQRHGLRILPIDIARSQWLCTVQPGEGRGSLRLPSPSCTSHAVRLGLRYVRGLREAAARAIVRAREERPFASIHDLARRAGLAGAGPGGERDACPGGGQRHRPPAAGDRQGVRLPLPRRRDGHRQRDRDAAALRASPDGAGDRALSPRGGNRAAAGRRCFGPRDPGRGPLAARPQRAVPRFWMIVLRHRAVPLTLLGTGELTMVGTQRAVPFQYAATSCRGRARWIAREAGPPAPQQPRLTARGRAALRPRP